MKYLNNRHNLIKYSNYLIILILILALFLRLPHLLDKQQGTDEKLSIRNANTFKENIPLSLSGLYQSMPSEVNPPLFFIMLGLALNVYNSVISLKIFILIISLLSILIFYLIIKKIFDEKTALFSTFFYSISPMHLILSQHIRAYILLILLFNLSLYFLYKFIFLEDKKSLVYLTIIYIISIYTHYYAILFIIGSFISVLAINLIRKNELLRKYIISIFLIILFAIPALLILKMQYSHLVKNPPVDPISLKLLPYPLYKMSLMVDLSTMLDFSKIMLILFPIMLILAFYGIWKLCKIDKEKCLFILSNFSVPYILLILMGIIKPVFSFRYIMFLQGLYTFLFAYGLLNIKNKIIKNILISLILIIWAILILYYYKISTIFHWNIMIAI